MNGSIDQAFGNAYWTEGRFHLVVNLLNQHLPILLMPELQWCFPNQLDPNRSLGVGRVMVVIAITARKNNDYTRFLESSKGHQLMSAAAVAFSRQPRFNFSFHP